MLCAEVRRACEPLLISIIVKAARNRVVLMSWIV